MWSKQPNKHLMRRQAGTTLIELIVAMVIVGVAVAGLVAAFNSSARGSVDPVIVRQMAAVAEGMMEEVLLKPYDAVNNDPGRANFDDIWDYRAYTDQKITDLNGVESAGLAPYRVSVLVENAALGNVPAERAARITVTVTYPEFPPLVLTGWRTRITQ